MYRQDQFDVIIVGGSYSGLAAAMSLGRALKKVMVIDEGKPCNRQTPYSHNFLTNDGKRPAEIASLAAEQVGSYASVRFHSGRAVEARQKDTHFEIVVNTGVSFSARKLIFATGISDRLPAIDGLAECWGISVIHCPYCHGYEVRDQETGILANGEPAFDFARLLFNWTPALTIYTNGTPTFSTDQLQQLKKREIKIVSTEIIRFEHQDGRLQYLWLKDGTKKALPVLYAPSPFEQHCKIPETLGCELDPEGYIKTDNRYETTVSGIYAIGDSASKMRTVANAVASGTAAGILVSKKLILDDF